MNKAISATLSAALILTVSPAVAGKMASKSWTNKVIERELSQAERRIERHVGQSIEGLSFNAAFSDPLHADLPPNTEITLAHVGEDLAVVALCMVDGTGDMWAGAFVISDGPDFAVALDGGGFVAADALGFLIRWTDADPHPTRPSAGIAMPWGPDAGIVNRMATAIDGEAFSFAAPWVVIFDSSDACEVTVPLTFGTNGSDVEMFPEGDDPVPLPTINDEGVERVRPDILDSWAQERFPWLDE